MSSDVNDKVDSHRDFVALVKAMRAAQVEYYPTRPIFKLSRKTNMELLVDKYIAVFYSRPENNIG